MFIRKKGFLSMLLLSLILLLVAFMTLIPSDQSEKISLLGYRSLDSLAPVSTSLLLAGSLAVNFIRKRYFLIVR